MVEADSREIVEGVQKERRGRDVDLDLFVDEGGCLQKEVSFGKSFAKEFVVLNNIPIPFDHLLQIPQPSMRQLCASRRSKPSKVLSIYQSNLQPSRRSLKHHPCSIAATPYNKYVELLVLEGSKMLGSCW